MISFQFLSDIFVLTTTAKYPVMFRQFYSKLQRLGIERLYRNIDKVPLIGLRKIISPLRSLFKSSLSWISNAEKDAHFLISDKITSDLNRIETSRMYSNMLPPTEIRWNTTFQQNELSLFYRNYNRLTTITFTVTYKIHNFLYHCNNVTVRWILKCRTSKEYSFE